jgi:hypothetical protein
MKSPHPLSDQSVRPNHYVFMTQYQVSHTLHNTQSETIVHTYLMHGITLVLICGGYISLFQIYDDIKQCLGIDCTYKLNEEAEYVLRCQ